MIESTQKINDQDSAITTTILCNGSLDISSASQLHEVLIDAIESGHPVCLDLDEATRIDTSCMQILFSFIKEAKQKHISIESLSENNLFTDTLKLIGLGDLLES